jgi:hypothetical protein
VSDLQKYAAEVEKWLVRRQEVVNRIREIRDLLSGGPGSFDRQIKAALVEGDTHTAAQLRDERAKAEAELKDLRKALPVVSEKLADAKAAFADAWMPGQKEKVAEVVERFAALATDVVAVGRELQKEVGAYRQKAHESQSYKREVGRVHAYPRDLPAPEGLAATLFNTIATHT